MNQILKYFLAILCITSISFVSAGKKYPIALSTDPDGAEVSLNGQKLLVTTPAIIEVDKKVATRVMIFTFSKEGYQNRSVTITYTKKQLKNNPIVYASLERDPYANQVNQAIAEPEQPSESDPTLTNAQLEQRVDRNNAGTTDMERTILRWYFDSDPRGARIFYRVISSVPSEVRNTNETYLTTTPLEETKSFNIQGLTYENSQDVAIEIKVTKRGYEDQIKRFNVRQALDQQEISGFFEMVPKESEQELGDEDFKRM